MEHQLIKFTGTIRKVINGKVTIERNLISLEDLTEAAPAGHISRVELGGGL